VNVEKKTILRKVLLTGVATASVAIVLASSAIAADQQPETVIVTGSRIPTSNLTSPSPVSIKDAAAIQMTAAYSLEDVLKTMPGTDISGLQNNANNGGVGLSQASVRGLGPPRTLVLIDGQRLVPIFVGSTSTPDLNAVPISMIERVEVLRDGASSVYGADAIGGVVNLITRKDFDGLQFNVDGGVSQHGGGDQYSFAATMGLNTDRANVTINALYQANGAIGQWQRDWSTAVSVRGLRGSIMRSQLPNLQDSQSSTTWIEGVPFDYHDPATTGLVPCTNYVDGRIRLNVSCDTPEGGWNTLQGSLNRTQISINGHYDLTNSVTFILQGTFTDRRSGQQLRPEPLLGDSLFTFNENTGTILYPGFFVPADPRWGYPGGGNVLPAGNQACPDTTPGAGCIDAFATPEAFGPRTYRQTSETYRIRAGFEGTLFNDYNWEVGYVQQRNEDANRIFNTGDFYHLAEAMGQIPCVDVPGGCVFDPGFGYAIPLTPPNFFDITSLTPEQIAYLKYTDVDTNRSIENYAYADIHGPLFDLPWSGGGKVQAALGVERRFEHLEDFPDKQVVLGYAPGRTEPTSGGYGVTAVYGELQIPLLRDAPLAKSLDLTTSARYDHYSTFGDATTYKIAANWTVTDDIRFRGSYETGFRAPSTAELFGGNAVSFNTVSGDPCDSRVVGTGGSDAANANMPSSIADANARLAPGSQCFLALTAAGLTPAQIAAYQSPENNLSADQRPLLLGGNPHLQPEKSHGFTVGTVITPTFLPGLNAGVDYYETTVTNAIQGGGGVPGAVGLDTFVLTCYAVPPTSATPFACSQIIHGTNGIKIINGQNANLGFNKVSGLELQLTFDTAAADMELPIPGSFVFDFEASREFQNILVIPNPDGSTTTIKYTSTFNEGNEVNDPAWHAVLNLDWTMDDLSVHWDTTWASHTHDLFEGSPAERVFGNELSDNWNSNISVAYVLGEVFPEWGTKNNTRIIFGVNNVFDTDPPFFQFDSICKCNSWAGGGYDFVGRFFYTRLQVKM